MLIWRHICFSMASLIAQCTFKIVNLSQQRYVFILTKLSSSRFIFISLLLHFDLIISSDSLIFLLLYLASLDNVFGCSQLNWQLNWQCINARVRTRYKFRLVLAQDGFQINSWCEYGFNFFLFKFFSKFRAKDWHPW